MNANIIQVHSSNNTSLLKLQPGSFNYWLLSLAQLSALIAFSPTQKCMVADRLGTADASGVYYNTWDQKPEASGSN